MCLIAIPDHHGVVAGPDEGVFASIKPSLCTCALCGKSKVEGLIGSTPVLAYAGRVI